MSNGTAPGADPNDPNLDTQDRALSLDVGDVYDVSDPLRSAAETYRAAAAQVREIIFGDKEAKVWEEIAEALEEAAEKVDRIVENFSS